MKPAKNIKELFSYRLHRLAFLSSAIAESINKKHFELDRQDWRLLALLGSYQPMSLNSLAKEANIDKSRASKSVASMTQRGLIIRKTDQADARGIQLSLSTSGQALYEEVFPQALSRNDALLDVLSPQERALLNQMLDKLLYKAKIMYDTHHPKHRKAK